MEVPGEKTFEAEIYCDPCKHYGNRYDAQGFCEDCLEYLCQDCYDSHTKPKPCRYHRLLDERAMPKSKETAGARTIELSTMPCPDHQHKMAEIYCCSHKGAVCGICAHNEHKTCETEDIGKVSQIYVKSDEYSSLTESLNQLRKTVDTLQNDVVKLIQDAEESMAKAVENVKAIKLEMIDKFEKMEKDLLKEAKKMKQEDKEIMESAEAECQSMKDEIARQKSELEKNQYNNSNLYIASKKALEQLQTMVDKFDRTKTQSKAITYSFKADETLKGIINSNITIGTISRNYSNDTQSVESKTLATKSHQQASHQKTQTMAAKKAHPMFEKARLTPVKSINVKTKNDKKKFWITGAVALPSGRLLLTDWNNSSIKLVDISTGTLTSVLDVSNAPWDVTVLPQDQAAVTLTYGQQIQVITTCGTLSPIRAIGVNGQCRGICSTHDKIVISFNNPVKVDIMDHHGGVLKTIINNTLGQLLFICPYYVAVASEEDRKVIYVSDYGTDSIMKLSMTGQVLFTYTDDDLKLPRGLAVSSEGELLVCSSRASINQVQLVSARGSKIRTLLDESVGLYIPTAVCMNEENNTLYVSNFDRDDIKVYKVD